jgi:hypothetical protein
MQTLLNDLKNGPQIADRVPDGPLALTPSQHSR